MARRLIIALGSLLLLAGCSTIEVKEGPAPGVRVEAPRLPQTGIRYNTAVIIDKSLENWDGKVFDPEWSGMFRKGAMERRRRSKIAVESTDSRRTATGTLEVWVVLRNRTDYSLQLECRTQFFDENKLLTDGPTAWQRIYLSPQSQETYREFSTKTKEVNYYYIEIREGR
jgi:uncharacterized protein YceK